VVSLDGQQLVVDQVAGAPEAAEALGDQLAQRVLRRGGEQILADIRTQSF
jgi:hydroxymethylbilane synthase